MPIRTFIHAYVSAILFAFCAAGLTYLIYPVPFVTVAGVFLLVAHGLTALCLTAVDPSREKE